MFDTDLSSCSTSTQSSRSPLERPSTSIGLKLGHSKYQAVQLFGSGSQANVYRARLINSDFGDQKEQFCALKVFEEKISQDAIQAERDVHEQLSSNANILNCIDYSQTRATLKIPSAIAPTDQFYDSCDSLKQTRQDFVTQSDQ